MPYTPFRAVTLIAALSLSATAVLPVSADPPTLDTQSTSSHTVPPAQTPSVQAPDKQGSDEQGSRPTAVAPSRHSTRGEYLARTALSYRGAPYRFGGRSSRSGFDCSGLVQAVCAKWGIFLPRAAHAQFAMGKPVKQSELQEGDLVFFSNTYKRGLSHVGIFIGDGKFLHAASRSQGVMVSKLSVTYHQHHYAGARRLDLSKLPPVPGEETIAQHIVVEETTGN